MYIKGSAPASKYLENAFRLEIFKLLKKEGRINDFIIENMMHWHHSGFNVYCGKTIWPGNKEGMETLARYTCPPMEDYPGVIFVRADDLYPGI